jgi:ubiquilin
MQTGQNVHDPLTQLNSHLGFGAMAGLNPFGDLGLNPNDPNMVREISQLDSTSTDQIR